MNFNEFYNLNNMIFCNPNTLYFSIKISDICPFCDHLICIDIYGYNFSFFCPICSNIIEPVIELKPFGQIEIQEESTIKEKPKIKEESEIDKKSENKSRWQLLEME
jgi:hypothetical protein